LFLFFLPLLLVFFSFYFKLTLKLNNKLLIVLTINRSPRAFEKPLNLTYFLKPRIV